MTPPTARRDSMALILSAIALLTTPTHAISEATLRSLLVCATNATIPIADILAGGPSPHSASAA